MALYTLIAQADHDLSEIWSYTAERWGIEQASRYLRLIDKAYIRLAKGDLPNKPINGDSLLRMVRVEQHYIFYLAKATPLVVRVLHVRMDYLARLQHIHT